MLLGVASVSGPAGGGFGVEVGQGRDATWRGTRITMLSVLFAVWYVTMILKATAFFHGFHKNPGGLAAAKTKVTRSVILLNYFNF
jgi:hypothetical protein